MQLTYTQATNLYGQLTGNSSAQNVALGATNINQGMRFMLGDVAWPFMERHSTISTVAGQQYYTVPNDVDKLLSSTIQVGTYIFPMNQVTSRYDWDRVNATVSVQSTIPTWFYLINGQLGVWAVPSASGNTLSFNYQTTVRDISIADYTTGSIVAATTGSTTVIGTGTAWTSAMAGRFLQITAGNAANSGDGMWYQVASVTNATTLVLVKPYLGQTFSAATVPYILGDCMIIPEKYQIGAVYWAVAEYFSKNRKDADADRYHERYEKVMEQMQREEGKKTTDPTIDDGVITQIVNPNLTIQNILP